MSGKEPARAALAALEERLGYRFRRRERLAEALTHASAAGRGEGTKRSNERLEFLGDRVLGLVIAAVLFERFPHDSEGALSQRHAALVRRETLAEVAAALELGRWLTLARSEDQKNRPRNPAILGNSLEAVIGALYLDGGLEAAGRFVRAQWTPLLAAMQAPPRDAKTALQEWAQARGMARPSYAVVRAAGPPHAPSFEVEVSLENYPPASATGPSKRAAEQAAAEVLLARVTAG